MLYWCIYEFCTSSYCTVWAPSRIWELYKKRTSQIWLFSNFCFSFSIFILCYMAYFQNFYICVLPKRSSLLWLWYSFFLLRVWQFSGTVTDCRGSSLRGDIFKQRVVTLAKTEMAAKRVSKSAIDWVKALENAPKVDKDALRAFKARQDAYVSKWVIMADLSLARSLCF